MSLTKRLRIFWALLHQEWHQQTCGDCQATWWAIGPAHPELIRICDACEIRLLNDMFEQAEAEYQRQTKGAA